MVKSKTKIEKHVKKKTNPELVKTIISAKKNDNWIEIASILSGPRRKRININLREINDIAKQGEIIVVPGKVLSQGEISKKVKIVALSLSEKAKEKLLKSKYDFSSIIEEIKLNPGAKGIKILK
jgi:large subunit ribosomal protein L18e